MNAKEFYVQPGERALICGHTGSGKSVMLAVQARAARHYPVVIYDTKGDDQFFDVPLRDEYGEGETMEVVEGLADFERMARTKRHEMPVYILVRPTPGEMSDPETLDDYLKIHYEKLKGSYALVDEAYQWHKNHQAYPGLIGMLTRGRSRKISTILCTQRPVYISRFCLTEAQIFYVYNLIDYKDRARLTDVVPIDPRGERLPDYHFQYYRVGQAEAKLFAPVTPLPPPPMPIEKPKEVIWL